MTEGTEPTDADPVRTGAPVASSNAKAPTAAAGSDEKAQAPVIAPTDPAAIGALVAKARAAQAKHAALDLEDRAALLGKFKNALLARGEELAETIVAECHKPLAEAWLHEVVPTADLAAYWTMEGPEALLPQERALDAMTYPGKRAVVRRHARGVVGLIMPWNLPVAIPLRAIFPALLAGDAVMLKPSEVTPRSGALLGQIASDVFGPDLVTVVQGGGEVGAALVGAGIDAVVFTGGADAGRAVARAAADALIPVALELGGNDAAVVLADADVERTARGLLWGAFTNTGQMCCSVRRIYAVGDVAGKLEKRMVALAKELDPARTWGPLATAAQSGAVAQRVRELTAAGGEVLCGGGPDAERFLPTIVRVEGDASPLAEAFGPVVTIAQVADEDTAIAAANAAPGVITSSLWTRDLRHAEQICMGLRAGVVTINDHGFSPAVPALPWSGVGESGYGVTNSVHTLDVLTRPFVIVISSRRAKTELWWYPYTDGLVQIARAMATLRGGAGLASKARALWQLIVGFVRRNR